MLKMNKKGASIGLDEILKKVTSSVFWEIKNKKINMPASSVFQKVVWETLVYWFSFLTIQTDNVLLEFFKF